MPLTAQANSGEDWS